MSTNPNLWGEPFNKDEFTELINEYSIQPKIMLKHEPKHLYDVVKTIIGETKTFSRACLVVKIKEFNLKNEKITRESVINSITYDIKSTSVVPNYFLVMFGVSFMVLLVEVS